MDDKKVLSQNEIDSLLGAFATEQDEPDATADDARATPTAAPVPERRKNVREYDFRRPSKLSKEHLRTLTGIYETMARVLTTQLSTQLRMAVTVTVASVDQSVYDDFIRDIGDSSILNLVTLAPLPGAVIWEVSEESTYAMVDRLLGGVGKPFQIAEREITEIELNLMRGIIERGQGALRDAWSSVLEIEPSLEDAVVGPQYVQIALPTDLTIVIVLEIRLNEATGTMSMCIPYSVLEPISSRLSTHALFSGRRPHGEDLSHSISASLGAAQLGVTAELGSATLSMGEVRSLAPGDVLMLDRRVNDPVAIVVAGVSKFLGHPRRRGRRLAVHISERLTDENVEVSEDTLAKAGSQA